MYVHHDYFLDSLPLALCAFNYDPGADTGKGIIYLNELWNCGYNYCVGIVYSQSLIAISNRLIDNVAHNFLDCEFYEI